MLKAAAQSGTQSPQCAGQSRDQASSNSAAQATLQARQLSAAAEQRRVFGHGFGRRPSSYKSTKGKHVKTCNLKFVCLASKDADHPPSTVKERTVLSNNGLGDGSILFPRWYFSLWRDTRQVS